MLTSLEVPSVHAIHIGRWSAEVGDISFETRHVDYLPHLPHNALLGTAYYELSLMGGDSTEGTTAEAPAMQGHRELYHLIGRDGLTAILRVWHTRVWQVVGRIEFRGCHWRIRCVDDSIHSVDFLKDSMCVHPVRLLLDMPEVLCLEFLVMKTLLMTVQDDVVCSYPTGDILFLTEVDSLWNVPYILDVPAFVESLAHLHGILLTHTVEYHIGTTFTKDTLLQFVLPIIIVCEPSHRSLNATEEDRNVRIELFQYLCIDYRRIVGTHVMTGVWAVGIIMAFSAVGGIAVHHGVHGTGGYGEAQPWPSQLLEVAVITMPVGLWNDGNLKAFRLKHTSYHRGTEGRVVDIRVAGKENDIQLIPSTQLDFLLCCRQEVGKQISASLVFHLSIGYIIVIRRSIGILLLLLQPLLIQFHEVLQAYGFHVLVVYHVKA